MLLVALLLFAAASAEDALLQGDPTLTVDYTGYKIIVVNPSDKDVHDELVKYVENAKLSDIECLGEAEITDFGRPTELLLSPEHADTIISDLQELGLTPHVSVEDVQAQIDAESDNLVDHNSEINLPQKSSDLNLQNYHALTAIHKYMFLLAEEYPADVKLMSIGSSLEGRDQKMVKIGRRSDKPKKGFFMHGCIHAREWISAATNLWIIDQLVHNETNKKYLEEIDFYIMPVTNPDGYEFSRKQDRLWRKSRSGPHCTTNGTGHAGCCIGVDLNRNFPYAFGKYPGASNYSCDVNYHGAAALSEIEANNVATFVQKNIDNLHAYVDLHNWGQLILYPYSDASNTYADDIEDTIRVAKKMEEAVNRFNSTYIVGTAPDELYPATGVTFDYMKSLGVKYSYTVELRPQTDPPGFILPIAEIAPAATEGWAALSEIANALLELDDEPKSSESMSSESISSESSESKSSESKSSSSRSRGSSEEQMRFRRNGFRRSA